MYDDLSKRQASVLAQLRTGMTLLNGYLYNIKPAETTLCDCDEAAEYSPTTNYENSKQEC
jgi:hypothetical protein